MFLHLVQYGAYPKRRVDVADEMVRQYPVVADQRVPVNQEGIAHSLQQKKDVHDAQYPPGLFAFGKVEHQLPFGNASGRGGYQFARVLDEAIRTENAEYRSIIFAKQTMLCVKSYHAGQTAGLLHVHARRVPGRQTTYTCP